MVQPVFFLTTFNIKTEHPVIRNAAGRAADALRSVALIDQFLKVEAVIIIQHTGKIIKFLSKSIC
jgi:hypothetical protein